MKIRIVRLCTFTLISLLSLFGLAVQAGAQVHNPPTSFDAKAETPGRRHALAKDVHVLPDGSETSSNYSGYVVTGATGSVTDVKGFWTVPAVLCTPSNSAYSSFWVGIDGWPPNNNLTVEQIGTESECQNGTPVYYAWYEYVPQGQVVIPQINVAPGDLIFAEVSFAGGMFTVTMTDKRKGQKTQPYSTPITCVGCPTAMRSSAEWIAEDPGIIGTQQLLPFANFGEVSFTKISATVAGKKSALTAITMHSDGTNGSQDGTAEAIPQPLADKSFSVVYADLQTLYSFCSVPAGCTDGMNPENTLIQDRAGDLYGTTLYGGAKGGGTVFELTRPAQAGGSWTETVLYPFCSEPNCADGTFPHAGVIRDAAGNLYGTANSGGANGSGTVFELGTAGQETVLYSFCPDPKSGCPDGSVPENNVVQDAAGILYGTTQFGGANGQGTVYEVVNGQETVLYSFCSVSGCADGSDPVSVILDAAGNLYGTTESGGANGQGTVFELAVLATAPTVLYSFCSEPNCADGSTPGSTLTRDAAGNLYGTTENGGANGNGTIFELDTTGQETVLYSFCPDPKSGCPDGSSTNVEPLIQDAAGNLYGTTTSGGFSGGGTVFKLAPPTQAGGNWTQTVLYTFCPYNGCTDGSNPDAGLLQDAAGNLYGTTVYGGANGKGTVFRLAATATATATMLTSSPNPSTYGQAVTFTAVVASSVGVPPPNGETVSFMNGGTVLGTGTLSDGSATFTTSALKAGTTTVTAIYGGDSNFFGSTSNAVKQVVKKAGE